MRLFPHPQSISIDPSQTFTERSFRANCTFEASPPLSKKIGAFNKSRQGPHTEVTLSLVPSTKSPQSYHLQITPDRISLTSPSEQGLSYGLLTLSQIEQQSPPGKIPCLEIHDWPDLEQRGFMLDVSRCKVPKIDSLLELIDQLSSLRYTQLQLYTEHTFAYQEHQEVWKDASPYTAEDIKKIEEACSTHFIELIPNQNTFGHFERWLKHDSYLHLAECPDGFIHPISGKKPTGSTLKPNQESLDFLEKLFDELLPNFKSKQFNIGGDEPWELGQGWSKDRVHEQGKQRVYLDFLKRIQSLAKDRNKTTLFWGDIILEDPDLISELPPGTTTLLWGYEANHPFEEQCVKFKNAKIPYYVCPGTSTWNSIGGRWNNALQNINSALENGITHNAHGFLLTEWGDFGHHQAPLFSYPSIAQAALLAWNFKYEHHQDHSSVVSQLLLKTSNPKFLEIIQALGTINDPLQRTLENATPLNRILFLPPGEAKEFLANIPVHQLTTLSSKLEELQKSVDSISPQSQNEDHLKNEISLAIQMLQFASTKALALSNDPTWPTSNSNAELNILVTKFKSAWLHRNRQGGLLESIENLQVPNQS